MGGGVALGLLRMGRTRQSAALTWGATVLGYGGLLGSAVGLLVVFNPWLTGAPFGQGLIWNGLFLAYLAPAVIYFALGWFSTGKRPPVYSNGALALGALLAATWINLSIRHGFHPVRLTLGPTTDAELYTYSVVWLIIGVGAMAAGIYMASRVVRIASVVILGLVAAKVFLIDMAGSEGILRAVSFIGLGATLVGIGLVYQRVLSSGGARPAANKPDQAPESG
ncbi:MAG: DUF2339 domain-containing protein [Alphaproteobacteria bacterium]|nr:DUF2339 domain-containing protein [Alphaproteobacteria bacterium]